MSEQSSNLSSIPRRFWTEDVARLALKQGDHDLAMEIAETLKEAAPPGEAGAFDQLLEDARAARQRAGKRADRERVLERLQACLRRARALRRERCAP